MKLELQDTAEGDLRQRRTRKLLMTALLELMEERPFKAISVVDICQRAMVHRTTFYAHFDDKQALLRDTILQLQKGLEEDCQLGADFSAPHDYYIALAKRVISFIREHREFYRSGVSGCSGGEIHLMEDLVAGEIARKLSEPEFQPAIPGYIPEIAAHFYAGAVLSLINWWLEHDMPVSDETLLRHLEYFIARPQDQKECDACV